MSKKKERELLDERNYRFAGEEKMGIVIGDGETDKYDTGVEVIMSKKANISDTSRGDFTLREVKNTNKGIINQYT